MNKPKKNDLKKVKTTPSGDRKDPSKVSVSKVNLQQAIQSFLQLIGDNPKRDGIKETPKRFEEAIKKLLNGYDRSLEQENKLFENLSGHEDIIILKNIDFISMCEHHLLPFFGYAHIGYVPGKKILGISKLARAVDIYSRRLQDQETLGMQIATNIMKCGQAKGVAVLIEARHLCNVARGVEKKMSVMTTCSPCGVMKNNHTQKQNFLELIRDRQKI